MSLLESENSVEAKMELYNRYLEEEDFVNAARVLNEMLTIYNPSYSFENQEEEDDYEDNINYFADIALIELDVQNDGRKISELNIGEIQTLQTIVNANLPVSAKAEVILGYNDIPFFERPIKKLTNDEMNDVLYNNSNNFDYDLIVSPNPANQYVDVCFNLPTNVTNIKIQLVDEYNHVGLLLDEQEMNGNQFCGQFDVSLYQSGTYRVLLEHDGQTATGQHLVILRY